MTTEYRIITAPVIIPDTIDCDYEKGEIPLSREKIQQLQSSFKNYQIIDYNHHFCREGEWYMRKLGTPIKSWISTKSTSYTDILGNNRQIPEGTWWLTCKITDPKAIQLIDENKLIGYSLTTANRVYADKIQELLDEKTNTSIKSEEQEVDDELHYFANKTRTLIKDIENPVGFTVSLTDFPCVSGAIFAKKCLIDSQKAEKSDNMTDNTNRFSIDEFKSLFSIFTSMKSNKDEVKEEQIEEQVEDMSEKSDVYVTKEEFDKLSSQMNEISSQIVSLIETANKNAEEDENGTEDEVKDTKESEKESESTEKTPIKEEVEETKETANKNGLSKEIPHNHDGIRLTQSFKNTTPEAKLMAELGRTQLGVSKFNTRKINKE